MRVATAGHGKPCPYRERKDGELPGQNGDAKGAKLAATHVRKKQDGGLKPAATKSRT